MANLQKNVPATLSSPPLVPGLNYYLVPVLDASSKFDQSPFALSFQDTSQGPGGVLQTWAPGIKSLMWNISEQYNIIPVTLPGNGLTAMSTSPLAQAMVLVANLVGSPAQEWTYQNNQLYINMGGEVGVVYLTIPTASPTDGTLVITYMQSSLSAFQSWVALPVLSMPTDQWFYLLTQMPNDTGDFNSYALTIPSGTITSKTQLVINPLEEGSLSQLWKMNEDGLLISALYPSMALTIASDYIKKPLTVSAINTGIQNWYLFPNGTLATGTVDGIYYANVAGGGNAGPGKVVESWTYTDATNGLWTVMPYTPVPEGLWFTIESPQSDNGIESTNLLTISEDGTVITDVLQNTSNTSHPQPGIAQLWKRTMAGNIVSALNPNIALTGDNPSGTITVSALIPGRKSQLWSWGATQAIPLNNGKDKIWAASLINVEQNQALTSGNPATLSAPLNPSGVGQQWLTLPYAMPFESGTAIRNLGGENNVPGLFMTLPEKPDSAGNYPITVNEISINPAFAMWRYQYPGYIVSNAVEDIVLSLELGTGGTAANPVYTTNVVAYPRQPNDQSFQLWYINRDGQLINGNNGQALAISTASSGASVVTQTVATSNLQHSLQQWDFSTGMGLQTVLAQPPVPFPQWTTNQSAAYNYLSAALNITTGIRSQYLNLAAPLSNYQSALNLMLIDILKGGEIGGKQLPSGPADSDYTTVVTQLNIELTAAVAVQLLFQQATVLYLSLSQAQAMTLSELITACALPNGLKTPVPHPPKKKKSWIGDLVEGLTYTALNVAGSFVGDPEAGTQLSMAGSFIKNGLPCIANLMATGFSTYQGAQQSGTNLTAYQLALEKAEEKIYNYEMTVEGLQQKLLNEFEALGTTLGQIETVILADWGKLQEVQKMIQDVNSQSSLYWPSTMTAMDADQMLTGYTIGVLKTLLPANTGFNITATLHANQTLKEKKPGWQKGSFYVLNDDNTYSVYATTVNAEVLDVIWATGTNPVTFFNCLRGWHLPVTYPNLITTNAAAIPVVGTVIVTVENNTCMPLGLTLNLNYLVGNGSQTGQNFPSITYDLPPYGAKQFAGGDIAYGLSGPVQARSLNGPVNAPGITITEGSSTIATIAVSNSYPTSTYKSPSDIDPCTYTWDILGYQYPYYLDIKQYTVSDGVVFVTIAVNVMLNS